MPHGNEAQILTPGSAATLETGVSMAMTGAHGPGGSRAVSLGGGRLSLRPSIDVGLRRAGRDAETGGGGLAFSGHGHGAVA